MLVAINAGHYVGKDPGCSGTKITEAELARDYAKSVCKYLEAAGVNTVFIQENELWEICDVANAHDVDLFVSIHFNAFNTVATGTETLYCNGSSKGQILASCIHNQVVSSIGLVDRGLKTNGLYVTKHTNAPACLVEVGFLDNPHDEEILLNKSDDAIRAIARGITDAINKIWPSSAPAPAAKPASSTLKPGMASKYFSMSEVTCHCCGRHGATPEILQFLDDLREAVGGPVEVTCVYRCPSHNAEVGGVPNSSHVTGKAADICLPPNWSVDELADLCERLGADGVGRYYGDQFVHADVRDGRTGTKYRW